MLNEKLIKIQSELKAPKDKKNNFGGYMYRSCESILEAVKPILKTVGCTLTISDAIVEVGGRVYVMATATLNDGESQTEVSAFAREPESKKGMDEPQVTGTASSYARKYALNGLFAIDDTKDADTDEYQTQEQKPQLPKQPTPSRIELTCAACGNAIGPFAEGGQMFSARAIAEKTKKRFGRCLCWECANTESRIAAGK